MSRVVHGPAAAVPASAMMQYVAEVGFCTTVAPSSHAKISSWRLPPTASSPFIMPAHGSSRCTIHHCVQRQRVPLRAPHCCAYRAPGDQTLGPSVRQQRHWPPANAARSVHGPVIVTTTKARGVLPTVGPSQVSEGSGQVYQRTRRASGPVANVRRLLPPAPAPSSSASRFAVSRPSAARRSVCISERTHVHVA